jgi:16S rRNA G1207 methylase RsmC
MVVNPVDILYRLPPKGVQAPPSRLTVDYDLVRLSGDHTRCAELADIVAATKTFVAKIEMHLQSHTCYEQIERDLAAAAALLAQDGVLDIVVHNHRMLRAVRLMAAVQFAEISLHKGNPDRLTCAIPLRAPQAVPTTAEFWYEDPVTSRRLKIRTRRGLFSYEHLDPGSALLLATLPPVAGLMVLDVGCGIGAIGTILAARGAKVTLIDSDARAIALASTNLADNHLDGTVQLHDARNPFARGCFDLVVSNPPTHAGSAALEAIFATMAHAAREHSACYAVVRKHLNYEPWLAKTGVVRITESDGYKILCFG